MNTVAEPSYRQRMAYHAGILGGICCLVSVLLIIGNLETHEHIQQHIETEKRATLAEVLPASLYDNEPLKDAKRLELSGSFTSIPTLYLATKGSSFAGAALQTSVWGWGSDIQLITAIDGNGEITGVRVIDHKETPGLADKIETSKSGWILTFNGRSLSNTPESAWAVKKDGGVIDQFTGATITPRAVVKGVHQSLQVLEHQRQQAVATQRAPEPVQ